MKGTTKKMSNKGVTISRLLTRKTDIKYTSLPLTQTQILTWTIICTKLQISHQPKIIPLMSRLQQAFGYHIDEEHAPISKHLIGNTTIPLRQVICCLYKCSLTY